MNPQQQGLYAIIATCTQTGSQVECFTWQGNPHIGIDRAAFFWCAIITDDCAFYQTRKPILENCIKFARGLLSFLAQCPRSCAKRHT